jgi:hypothetical protein
VIPAFFSLAGFLVSTYDRIGVSAEDLCIRLVRNPGRSRYGHDQCGRKGGGVILKYWRAKSTSTHKIYKGSTYHRTIAAKVKSNTE